MRPEERFNIHHRVRLFDGREIEVVYHNGVGAEARSASSGAGGLELHDCFHCMSKLVEPVSWSREADGAWRILLRCPECEATREGVFERDQVQRLEQELEGAAASLLRDLKQVTSANMSEEIERFVNALNGGLILPFDF